jgi:hypothetical protein
VMPSARANSQAARKCTFEPVKSIKLPYLSLAR